MTDDQRFRIAVDDLLEGGPEVETELPGGRGVSRREPGDEGGGRFAGAEGYGKAERSHDFLPFFACFRPTGVVASSISSTSLV